MSRCSATSGPRSRAIWAGSGSEPGQQALDHPFTERLQRVDTRLVVDTLKTLVAGQHVLALENEFSSVLRVNDDAEFRNRDRPGVAHELLDHIRIDRNDPVDGLTAALREEDLRRFGSVREVCRHRHVEPHRRRCCASGAIVEPEVAVAVEHLLRTTSTGRRAVPKLGVEV